MRRLDTLGLVFVLIWSGGYVVGSVAAGAAPPLAVTFWRLAGAGPVLAGVAIARRERWPTSGRTLAAVALVGVLILAVQFGGVYLALGAGMPADTSALLVSCGPLLVAAIGAGLGSERLSRQGWLGAALGIVGVVLALAGHLARPGSLAPVAFALVGLAGLVTGTLLQRRLPEWLGISALAAVECVVAAATLAPVAVLHGGLAIPLDPRAVGATAWLTLFNAVGGPLVFFTLIRRRGATRATSLLFCVPAVTALVAWPVLGQPISVGTLAGLAVAGAGVALMQRRTPVPQSVTRRCRCLLPTLHRGLA